MQLQIEVNITLDATDEIQLPGVLHLLKRILHNQEIIMVSQQEVLEAIDGQSNQLDAALIGLNSIQDDVNQLKALAGSGAGLDTIKNAIDAMSTKTLAVVAKVNDIDSQTAPTGSGTSVSTCNEAGSNSGACALGQVISNDDPALPGLKANGFVDTVVR